MKIKKNQFIAIQIMAILVVCYSFLFEYGDIFRTNWGPTFVFALTFFHLGTFFSLYITISIKEFTEEKFDLIFKFFLLIYISFLVIICCDGCIHKTNDLIGFYLIGLVMSFFVIALLIETYKSFYRYKSSQIKNSKN